VAAERPALRPVGLELAGEHAHGHAGVAVVAIGAVGECPRAAEARGDQRAVGLGVDQVARRGGAAAT
jgi:hypothetical protein